MQSACHGKPSHWRCKGVNASKRPSSKPGQLCGRHSSGIPSRQNEPPQAALALAGNREVNYGAALALALSGDSTQAEKLANDMEKRYPEDTSVRFSYLPVIRAVVAVQHGEPMKAIDALQASVPYEMGSPRSSQTGSSALSTPSSSAARRFWRRTKARRRRTSFKRSSAIAGS